MSNEKIIRVFDLIVDNRVLTYELLKKHNFTDDEISYLLDEDIIYETNADDCYSCYIDDLLDYAKDLLNEKLFSRCESVVDRCYNLAPNDYEVVCFKFLNEFMNSIRINNYDNVIPYLEKLNKIADDYQSQDVNTCIFLLSFLTKLPDELKSFGKYIKLDDLIVKSSDDRYDDVYTRNDIRRNIYFQKFSIAQKLTKNISDKTKDNMIYDRSIVKILEESYRARKRLAAKMCNLSKDNKYDEIIKIYNEEDENRQLSRHEEYVLKLALILKSIIETKNVPIANYQKNGNVYTFIDNNDFKGALNKVIEVSKNSKALIDDSANYILLKKINEEIEKIKNKKLSLTNKSTSN